MAKYHNILNNIKKVEAIEARYLNDITVVHGVGVLLHYWRNFFDIPLSALAEVEMLSNIENKSRLVETKLTFHSPCSFDIDDRNLCFRVTTVQGASFLIGTDTLPFPVVSTTELFPGEETGRSGCTVVATYKNTHGMLAILD